MVFFSLCSLAKRLPCYRIHVEQSIAYVSLYEYTASALDVLMLSTGEDVNDAIGTSVAVIYCAVLWVRSQLRRHTQRVSLH